MDKNKSSNSSNNLPNNIIPQNPKPEEELPVAKNVGNKVSNPNESTEDVLDPEESGKQNTISGTKNSNLGKDKEANGNGEKEDVLDPEAESDNKNSRKNKDDKKDDKKDDTSGNTTSKDGSNSGTKGDSPSDVKTGDRSSLEPNNNMSNAPEMRKPGGNTGTPQGTSTPKGLPSGTPSAKPMPTNAPVTNGVAGAATGGTAGATGAAAGGVAAGGTGAAAGGAGATAGIGVLGLIAIIVIALIGLLGFLFNMPGLMIGKLKDIAQGLWDGVQGLFITQADAFINDDDIVKLAQYIDDMDYDLVGYGFIRPNDEDYKTYLEVEDMGYTMDSWGRYSMNILTINGPVRVEYYKYYYNANGDIVDNTTGEIITDWYKDEYGIKYWAEDGEKDGVSYTKDQIAKLDDVDVSLLRMYLMSDYRITVLKNDDESWTNEIWESLSSTFGGSPNAWSKGLIKLYKSDEYGVGPIWDGVETLWWNDAKITDNGTKLSIRAEYFNRPMEFELDGWTGRYGLSLEFLLSLHLGTMAPDLVTAMVQSFDTEVQVYCEKIKNSQVLTKYVDYTVDSSENGNDEEVTIEEMNEVLEAEGYWVGIQDGALIEWVNELSLNKKKCLDLLRNTGLSSPPNCIYTAVAYVIKYMHPNGNSEWPGLTLDAVTEDDNYLSYFYGVIDSLLEDFEYRVDPLTDEYYTAFNSLYSLRNDNQLGWGGDSDTIPTEIESGLRDYVNPDRDEAIRIAKQEYLMPDDMSVEPDIEENYTGSSVVSGKAEAKDGYVIVDGYVYRIQREILENEWSLYGYLTDDNEFKIGTEEDFNTNRDNLPWEETTAYLNSYIYKIYRAGYTENNQMILYGENITSEKGILVEKVPVKYVHTANNIEIDDVISIYYDDDYSTERMKKFRFFDKDGIELRIDNSMSDETNIIAYLSKEVMEGIYVNGNIGINYNEADEKYVVYVNHYDDGLLYEVEYFQGKEISEEFIQNGGIVTIQDEFLYDVLYLNFVVRDKTLEELVQCGILTVDENGNYVTNEDEGKCSVKLTEGEDITKCCTVCQRYVKGVIRALAQIQDTNYAYYQPYIARVVGSWFRDTYFIIPDDPDFGLTDYYGDSANVPLGAYGTGGSYVKVDEEYLNSSGEYWTDYEMKKERLEDEEGNPILDAEGNEQFIETDEYQLYYLEPDGTTSDKTLEIWLTEEHDGKTYTSQEEAEKDGYVFVKRIKLLSIQDIKDNTQDDKGGGRDTPYMREDVVWSAYTVGDGGSQAWIQITREDEIENVNEVLDMVNDEGKFYYKIISTKSIEQEEDAIRTETNATVKNLFRYRQFYIYDGTSTKAELIQEDREKVTKLIQSYWANSSYSQTSAKNDLAVHGRYALREAYGLNTITIFTDENSLAESWLEYQLDMYYRAGNENALTDEEKERFKLDELCEYGIDNTYITEDGETVTYLEKEYYTSDNHSLDPRDRNLIATVNITKSSLDAFSILENVNTLDADYQYRDFKELIVELNYFDKEDLSETIEEVFTWLVPTYTTMWPIQAIDKQNNDYGTLVHSQDSIDFLIKVYEKLVEEEKALSEEEDEDDDSTTSEVEETESEDTVDMSKVYYIGDSWFVGLKNVAESPDDYFTAEVGAKAGDEIFNNMTIKSDASAIVIMLGLNGATTQYEMKTLLNDLSVSYANKNIYVLKVFHVGRNYTNMDKDELNSLIDTYNEDISEYCSTKNNLTFVDATEGLIGEDGYLNPDYESNDGMHLTDYEPLYENIKKVVEEGEVGGNANSENEQILLQLKEATSYNENDAVVSPVTGRILSYGEHERINVYTNEVEKVGYVQIEVMGYGEDKTDANKSYFTKGMLENTSLTDEEKEEAVKGLNSFYDEYKDQCAGYILTIDGIDVTDLKNGFSSITDAEGETVEYDSLCQYEPEAVVALYNSKEQQRREEEAEAKAKAPYLISYNATYTEVEGEYFAPSDEVGGYYVKEGAYLGKTQAPTDRTGEKREQNVGVQTENPNLSEDSETVDEDPVRTVDIRKLYDEFLEDKNPAYLRLILLDTEMTVIDNVEDYFPGFEGEFVSDAELNLDLLTIFINSYENGPVMDYILGIGSYSDYVAKYITEDKKYFICYYDYTRTRNYGFGVCHQPNVFESPDLFYHVEAYASVGVDIRNGHSEPWVSKCEVSKVLQVQSMLIENTFVAEVEAKLEAAGITLQQHQKDALTDIAYQYGTGKIDDFITAYKSGNPESYWVFHDETYAVRNARRLHLYKTGEYLDGSGNDLKDKLERIGGSLNLSE